MIPLHNMKRKAFTMIELIFVIVIMGIIGKFGVEFLAQAYQNFISSSINNRLQSNTTSAVEFISSRLQYRIKASTIARETNGATPPYTLLSDYFTATAPILEWVGADIDGLRGTTTPHWSGIIDLNSTISHATALRSPGTNTGNLNTHISTVSNGSANINDAAIYFVNPDAIPSAEGWGWDGNGAGFDTQINDPANPNQIHPIRSTGTVTDFLPQRGDKTATNTLAGVEAFEFYQLAWSAYAVGIAPADWDGQKGTLRLWYNYQPWQGEVYTDGNSSVIMEDVSSFRFIASGSLVKIQVCVKSDLLADEEYAICKEKTVF